MIQRIAIAKKEKERKTISSNDLDIMENQNNNSHQAMG